MVRVSEYRRPVAFLRLLKMARLSVAALLCQLTLVVAYDQLQYVDQLIGTDNGGEKYASMEQLLDVDS